MLTLEQLKEIIGSTADQVSQRKDGSFVCRRGYFYHNDQSVQGFMLQIATKLNEAKVKYEFTEYYDHWAPLGEGAPLHRQSHFAVVFKSKE